MKPRDDATKAQRVVCAVCGKAMRLTRTVSAPALGRGYEFRYWECTCGNVKVLTDKKPAVEPGGSPLH